MQGRGWIKHPSLKNTLIAWKASIMRMNDCSPSSRSVLNGFFFFSPLFDGWHFLHPQPSQKSQSKDSLHLNVFLRIKATHSDPRKEVRRENVQSLASVLWLWWPALATILAFWEKWGQWITGQHNPVCNQENDKKNSHKQRKPCYADPTLLCPWDCQVKINK